MFGDQRRFLRGARVGCAGAKRRRGSFSHRGPAPLVAANVDEHPDEPGFLVRGARRHRCGRRGRAQERSCTRSRASSALDASRPREAV